MSARQRAEARSRAVERGRKARDDGQQRTDNPYKLPSGGSNVWRATGGWSLYPAWAVGWQDRDNELAKQAKENGA